MIELTITNRELILLISAIDCAYTYIEDEEYSDLRAVIRSQTKHPNQSGKKS